jgi:hypothetical protein
MASISENWSARFRSCCKKVFRGFFFFLGCALVVAHRIVWYDMAAIRDASGLVAAIEHVVSLLNGVIVDVPLKTMPMQVVVAMCQKFGRRFGKAKALVLVDTSTSQLPPTHFLLSKPFY